MLLVFAELSEYLHDLEIDGENVGGWVEDVMASRADHLIVLVGFRTVSGVDTYRCN